jgi:ribonuclease J
LSFAGIVVITVILDGKGRPLIDPVVVCDGLPEEADETAFDAACDALDKATQSRKREARDEDLAETVRKAVRRAVQNEWGKRPVTRVEVVRTS